MKRELMEVEMAPTEQGIVVFDGTGSPLHLVDSMQPAEVADLMPEPVSRRVLVARLRAWADVIDRIDREPAPVDSRPVRCRRCGKTVQRKPDGQMRDHKMGGSASGYCREYAG